MLARFRFEFTKLCSLIILPFLVAIYFLSFFDVNAGIKEFKEKYKEYEINSKIENCMSELQLRYEQYGIYGHHLFILPSPLIIYFYNSSLFKELESNISTSEIIRVYSNVKGDKALKNSDSDFGDFGTIVKTFGSLLMLILGVMAVKNRKLLFKGENRVFLHSFLRLLLLDIYWILLLTSMFLFALFRGIPFSSQDFHQYVLFAIVTLLYLNLWFYTGLFLSFLMNYKGALIVALTIWGALLVFVPGIRAMLVSQNQIKSEEVNLTKVNKMLQLDKQVMNKVRPLLEDKDKNFKHIKNIMREGAKNYVAKENLDNLKLEQELQKSIKVQSDRMEDFSCFLPWSFYPQVQESLSSKGYEGYDGFVNFAIEQRDGFFRYIIDKRYNANDPKVIPYFKKGENVYHSKSTWPRKSWIGVLSTVVFSLLFIGLSLLVYRGQRKKENSGKVEVGDIELFESQKEYFYFCKTRVEMEELKRFFQAQDDTSIIEKVDLHSYDPGTSLNRWIDYIAGIEGFDKDELMTLLGALMVSEKELKLSPWKITDELFRKVYLALKMCERKQFNVLVDFFRGDSDDFEVLCKAMMDNRAYRFIYLSDRKLKDREISPPVPTSSFQGLYWLHRNYVVR